MCYVSIFLIFILPAVTRRGLFALRLVSFLVIDGAVCMHSFLGVLVTPFPLKKLSLYPHERIAPGFTILDTDELDYFRWISYLLDAIRPSTDFLLYIIVSAKFRASFLTIVSFPCAQVAKWAKRCRQRKWCAGGGGCGGRGHDDDASVEGLRNCLLCGRRATDMTELSSSAPFHREV